MRTVATSPPYQSHTTNSQWNPYSCHGYPRPTWIVSVRTHRIIMHSNPVSAVPASPSDTCSSIYSDLSPSPPPSLHVVCDIPVVAPRPLPYHSPTFLQFDLPDVDEDLSHPPYTRCSNNRKRKAADDFDDLNRAKRRAASPRRHSAGQLVQGIQTRRRR
jgi:hypothetical protein